MESAIPKKIGSWNIRLSPKWIPVLGFLAALIVGGIIIAIAGVSPFLAYQTLIKSAFGSAKGLTETLVKATPLLLAGLGIAIAYRAEIITIGAEGQIYAGALGAAYVGLFMGEMSPFVGIPLSLLAGFLAGAVCGGIAGVLKVRFGTNEIIVTLMLNYIAIELTNYLISDPWRDPSVTEPFTALFAQGTWLPVIFPGTRLHAGFLVAVIATLFLWWLFKKTVFGYQLSVLGANPKAAEYGGLRASRLIVVAMLISGGLAGLGGVSEVLGIHHRVIEGISPGYGYTAIAITLLGKKHPIGVLLAAFLFAALEIGADGMQQVNGVPVSVALILQALVLLFILVGDYLADRYELVRMKEG